MDMRLELVAVPVTDVDRAKDFYVHQVGFHLDHDHTVNEQLRFVQLTPPGSACSIVMGVGVTEMAPGSQKGLQVVVEDAEAATNELRSHGVETSDVQVAPWGKFVFFSDPDGNTWSVQQLPEVRPAPLP
jgi:catechol 2,3-dioxygenase-like lactoylglutathione lyase family enzyme